MLSKAIKLKLLHKDFNILIPNLLEQQICRCKQKCVNVFLKSLNIFSLDFSVLTIYF